MGQYSDLDEILDTRFKNAQDLIDSGDYLSAMGAYENIKRYARSFQADANKWTGRVCIGAGVLGGFAMPGVGNIVGGVIGGLVGKGIGWLVSQKYFYGGHTVEDVIDLAGAGKLEASLMHKNGRNCAGVPSATILQRYEELKREFDK